MLAALMGGAMAACSGPSPEHLGSGDSGAKDSGTPDAHAAAVDAATDANGGCTLGSPDTCPSDLACVGYLACDDGDPGVCVIRDPVCGLYYAPVCGCDGVTYSNGCDAAGHGASIRSEGVCP